MLVLMYSRYDCDSESYSVFDAIAASESHDKLEARKKELLAPSEAYDKARADYDATCRKTVLDFCEENRHALKDTDHPEHMKNCPHWTLGHPDYIKKKQDDRIKWLSECFFYFETRKDLKQWFFLDKIKGEPPKIPKMPLPPKNYYDLGGFKISKIEVI